jgi:hypothetical protein
VSRNTIPGAGGSASNERRPPSSLLPPSAIELVDLRCASIEHRLGYFRDEPFVIFGYCPGGGEVIWKDGHSSGFGTGGWKIFLQEIAPLAAACGARIGDLTSAGTHVLLMDRIHGAVYALPRESAEDFLSRAYGLPRSTRRCLCALLDCTSCPLRAGCIAAAAGGHGKTINRLNSELTVKGV